MTLVGCGALKCVSMSDQEWKIIPAIMNIDSNEPLFYSYTVLVNKCSGSCNDINNSFVFNPMSRTNKTCHISSHETCGACKCRLDASVCYNNQRWNSRKWRYECKELIDKGRYDDGFVWNCRISESECDKSLVLQMLESI